MSQITAEEFIRVWQSSKTVKEVCERLGVSKQYAYLKASLLRQHNIQLKRHSSERLDYAKLAELAKELE